MSLRGGGRRLGKWQCPQEKIDAQWPLAGEMRRLGKGQCPQGRIDAQRRFILWALTLLCLRMYLDTLGEKGRKSFAIGAGGR